MNDGQTAGDVVTWIRRPPFDGRHLWVMSIGYQVETLDVLTPSGASHALYVEGPVCLWCRTAHSAISALTSCTPTGE